MKINIIGAGSMGIVLSYFLHKKNEVVLMVKRGEKKYYEDGLVLWYNGKEEKFVVKISEGIEDSDLTIIAVKSYDLQRVYASYNLKGKVILIQNGLTHISTEIDGVLKIYAVTTWASKRLSKGVAELTGKGYFRLGSKSGEIDLRFLRESGIEAEWVNDIELELYRKAAINAVINPITSLFGVKNGQLPRVKELWSIASATINELEELFSKMGYRLEVEKNVLETCKVTADNDSSMLQDIRQGKRTEIDSITGELISLGLKSGVDMKTNIFLYDSIKFLQSHQSSKKNNF
jgi:2-dehydropantoate 2-reductase